MRRDLIAALGVVVGLCSGLGLSVGLGANLNATGIIGPLTSDWALAALSARDRFLVCSMTEAVAEPEEVEAMIARWRGHHAEPHWGVP
jgi:hypothetical protein